MTATSTDTASYPIDVTVSSPASFVAFAGGKKTEVRHISVLDNWKDVKSGNIEAITRVYPLFLFALLLCTEKEC